MWLSEHTGVDRRPATDPVQHGGRWTNGCTGRRCVRHALWASCALFGVFGAGLAIAGATADAATPSATDVVFVFDTSGSMSGALTEAQNEIKEVMAHVSASLPNVEYGVAGVEDIPGYMDGGLAATEPESAYEQNPEKPWRLWQPVTAEQLKVEEAIGNLSKYPTEGGPAHSGGDGPEAYGRALYETSSNPLVGWRPGVRHLIVLVADNVPHAPNLNEGIPPEHQLTEAGTDGYETWPNTGEEEGGKWGIPDTQWKPGESLEFHTDLKRLANTGKPLEMVDYHDTTGLELLPYWQQWAAVTGGQALEAGEGTSELSAKLTNIIETGAVAAPPPCPAGQARNEGGECIVSAPPPPPPPAPSPQPPPPPPGATSDNGLGSPAPTCPDHSVTLAGAITVEASCFHLTSGGQLAATGHIRVNGLDIVASGSGGFTLDTKSLTLSAKGEVDAYAGSLHIYHGTLSWKFKQKLELGVPKNFKIKGLPVGGNAALSLASGGVNVAVNATVGKSPYKVSGEIDLKLKLATGLELSSFKLELASDLPIKSLVVHKASLSYKHQSSGDVWSGAVEVELPAKGPTVAGNLTVTNGDISEVALNVSGIDKPLGEVVFLQSLGLEVSFAPKLSATGSIGLSAGPAIDGHTAAELDGSLMAEVGEPFVLDAKGSLSLVEKKLAEAEVKATIPGGVVFKGKLTASFLVIDLEGTIKGEVTSKSFYAQGGVTIHAPVVTANGDGAVNNTGLAGCASAQIGVTVFGHFVGSTVTIGGAHRWSGQNSIFTDSCGFGRLTSALAARAAALPGAATVVHVPPHTRQLNLIVHGAGGPPEVQLREGATSAIVSPNTTGALGHTVYLAIGDPADGDTDIAIAKPTAGNIAVSSLAGQPPLASVASALPLPNPRVRVHLRHLRGRRFGLSWSARKIPGQRLVFQDTDARGAREVLATSRAHGHIAFTAVDNGAPGAHRLRIVVEQEGLVREVRSGPAFYPAPVRLRAPHVHVRLRGGAAVIAWSAVREAASYYVSVATSDGRHLFFALASRQRSLRVRGAGGVTAQVWGVGAGLERGRLGRGHTHIRRAKLKRKHHPAAAPSASPHGSG